MDTIHVPLQQPSPPPQPSQQLPYLYITLAFTLITTLHYVLTHTHNQVMMEVLKGGLEEMRNNKIVIRISSVVVVCGFVLFVAAAFEEVDLNRDLEITWGDGRASIVGNDDDHHNNGQTLKLLLDRDSGSGFQSKNQFLFGNIDVQIKLVPGDSAGTVTAYYLSSLGSAHDEIDFEFLGNLSGDPYILHTNIYTQGKGGREEQFYLWFDPTENFHTYSILWNPLNIILYADGTPIRVFKNMERRGVAFPEKQAMKVYSSLWNADQWATRGGAVKTNWSEAPFIASYRNFDARKACVWTSSSSSSSSSCSGDQSWLKFSLNDTGEAIMKWVQKNFMIYSYCNDTRRFPLGPPPECSSSS